MCCGCTAVLFSELADLDTARFHCTAMQRSAVLSCIGTGVEQLLLLRMWIMAMTRNKSAMHDACSRVARQFFPLNTLPFVVVIFCCSVGPASPLFLFLIMLVSQSVA